MYTLAAAAASVGDPMFLDPDDKPIPDPAHADPLIEVHSITIHPYDENASYYIWGRIYVLAQSDERKTQLYSRSLHHPETQTAGKGCYSLSLTGPTRGPISMVRMPSIFIRLRARRRSPPSAPALTRCFALTSAILDTSTQLCFEEPKSLTLQGSLGVVRVNYIVLPCASIAYVRISLTKGGGEEEEEEEEEDTGSPGVHVSGSIIASYGKTISGNFACDSEHPASFILHNKSGDECDTVAFGVPIKLSSRSFVCIPAYSSLLLALNLTFSFKDFGSAKDIIFSINKSTEFRTCDSAFQDKYFCVGKYSLKVMLDFFTSDNHHFLEYINIRPESPPSAFIHEPPEGMSLRGCDRVEVLSVFVGHDSQKIDDVYGIIGLRIFLNSCYIFTRDEKHPDNLSHRRGKALSLEGLTTGCSDSFCLYLRFKDVSGLVDIHNYLYIYYYHYDIKRSWFNRPLCSVVFGKQGFAVVHYIIFEKAVKATVNISVVAKKVSDSLPVVYGALVAQYSNYEYATTFQKNYWRSVLFEEPQEKDARQLSEDGEIPLSKNVVSVPMGSNLVIDVDLHASVRPSAGATSDDDDDDDDDDDVSGVCNEEEHFKCFVELEFGDFGCKKLTGEYYDVLFSTKWANGSSEC